MASTRKGGSAANRTRSKSRNRSRSGSRKTASARNEPQQRYKPKILVMDNTDELIKISRQFVDYFMTKSVRTMKGDFWIRKTVTDKMDKGIWDESDFVKVRPSLMRRTIGIVSKVFNENGLDVEDALDTENDTNIEVHYANAGDKEYGSDFAVHENNDGGIEGKLHTCIVYLDITCEGGMLEVYDDTGEILVDTIDPRVDPKTGSNKTKVVMFNGGMMHCPTSIRNGKRVIVTYQFRQKELGFKNNSNKNKGGTGSKVLKSKPKSFIKNAIQYSKYSGVG